VAAGRADAGGRGGATCADAGGRGDALGEAGEVSLSLFAGMWVAN